MRVGFVRPNVSELLFHVFERSLHPELFDIHRTAQIRQANFQATIRICDAGHVVQFASRESIVTEVLASRVQPLPTRMQIIERRIKASRDETLRLSSGLAYHTSFQIEKLNPEQFLNMHEELLLDCQRAPISHCFEAQNRLAPAALSFIQTDVWPHSLLVHSFHTYPEECAIVKTQSLFEL
jgi:hypothetical protein